MYQDVTISLNKNGQLFFNRNNKLYPTNDISGFEDKYHNLIRKIQIDPYQTFFKYPFSSIIYNINNNVINSISAHPNSFYPGTPFDVFDSCRTYLLENKLIIPRFYLYPTSKCNSNCIICPFINRHSLNSSIPYNQVTKLVDHFSSQNPKPKRLSVIISGDGEPTSHNDITSILDYIHNKEINIFLSSNFILPSNKLKILNTISRTVSTITFSIKGLNPNAYNKYQGIKNAENYLEQVLLNIKELLNILDQQNIRKHMLLGVATLILPENTGYYIQFTQQMVEMGIDYIYYNVVEPSYKDWNIHFSADQISQTLHDLNIIEEEYRSCNTMIRFPHNPFKQVNSVYYDARNRKVKDICGSALFNPLFASDSNNILGISCRAADKFNNNNFHFNYKTSMKSNNLFSNYQINKVMKSSQDCDQCRLERQVTLYDSILQIDRQNNFKGDFLLNFNLNSIHDGIGSIQFEKTIS